MFTVEIRVNSTLVSHIYGRNVNDFSATVSEYYYEHYQAESGKIVTGHVEHDKENGLNKLISLILSDVETKNQRTKHANRNR